MATASARRVGELGSFLRSAQFLPFLEDRVALRTRLLLCQRCLLSFIGLPPQVVLPVFVPDPQSEESLLHLLDVKHALLTYLSHTASFCKVYNLSLSVWLDRASLSTLSHWLKEAILLAYDAQDGVLAHPVQGRSTRSVAVSWAAFKGEFMRIFARQPCGLLLIPLWCITCLRLGVVLPLLLSLLFWVLLILEILFLPHVVSLNLLLLTSVCWLSSVIHEADFTLVSAHV